MTVMATGAGMLAHVLHDGLVVAGLLTLAVVLLPHVLRRFDPAPVAAVDAHDHRVLALRAAVTAGTLTARPGPASYDAASAGPATTPPTTPPTTARTGAPVLTVAVVASGAAAAIHVAAAPHHVEEGLLVGAFFVVVALAQLGWAAVVSAWCAVRPGRGLLRAAVVGNTLVLLTWLVSRVVGAEPLGVWDLACAGWELLVVGCCLTELAARRPAPPSRPDLEETS